MGSDGGIGCRHAPLRRVGGAAAQIAAGFAGLGENPGQATAKVRDPGFLGGVAILKHRLEVGCQGVKVRDDSLGTECVLSHGSNGF